MTIYLGLDGGGSGCRARAMNASGQVIGQGLGGPANLMTDLDGALLAINAAVADALGPHDTSTVSACLGLAGAITPDRMSEVSRRLSFANCTIVTDWFIAAKGALGEADGIVASIGTGSVFVEQRAGKLRAVGGRGLVLGDEGSGAWIGRSLLSAALHSVDGLRPQSPLLQTMIDRFQGAEGIIAFAALARPADFAALAPRVTNSDDAAARAIMDSASRHVLDAIAALQQPDTLPVVCVGGLAHVFEPVIATAWPVVPAMGTPLDGALGIARASGQSPC